MTSRTLICALIFFGSSLADFPAHGAEPAPTKKACLDANLRAQDARRDKRLIDARAALRICVDPACPAVVRDDCAVRLDDVDKALPTIVFEAKSGAGDDLAVVTVTLDGKPFAEKLDGTPIPVDPGEHTFVFTVKGVEPTTKTLVVHEGERGRRERITIGPAVTAKVSDSSATPGPAPGGEKPVATDSAGAKWQRPLSYVLGGVGVVGLGLGTVLGLKARSDWNDSKNTCASPSNCSDHDASVASHDKAVDGARNATIAFVAGGLFLAGGIVLFLTTPKAPSEHGAPAVSLALVPTAGPSCNGLLLDGSF